MDHRREKKEQTQAAMPGEIDFQPFLPAAHLKENQNQVQNSKDENYRNSSDGHFSPPFILQF